MSSVTAQCTLLFQAIEQHGGNADNTSFAVVTLLSSIKDRNKIIETIKSSQFHKNHARRLFAGILPVLKSIIEEESFIPASAFLDDDEQDEEEKRASQGTFSQDNKNRLSSISNTSVVPDEDSSCALSFMKYTAMMLHGYLQNVSSKKTTQNKQQDVMDEVKELTELLHDNLFELNPCGVEGLAVQKHIITLCESFWICNFVDRNDYVASVIPLLLLRTLDGNATKSDIKRLWNMRDALHLFSFHDENIAYLRSLIVRTVGSALYLKNTEGRKMISYFFQLDGDLVKSLHDGIKAQIPMAKKPCPEYYGEIYFRAWKMAHSNVQEEDEDRTPSYLDEDEDGETEQEETEKGKILSMIEESLQELMNASVHVSSPHMTSAIQSVLETFYIKKKSPEVETLLFKMFTPFLWRSLSAANAIVRVNASIALGKTYPLRDPLEGKTHLNEVYSKSVQSLVSLLRDDDHKVRVAACEATVQILGHSWDALESKDIRSLLNEIISRHSNDSSSAAVRIQAINGISKLLDAKASHGVLKTFLPLLGDHIHDKVERVRLATANLLLKLKKIKGFKYYHTVPVEHILARMASEGEFVKKPLGPVAGALTELTLNSYCPTGVNGSEQVNRIKTLILQNPKAAKVFFNNIPYYLEIRDVTKLIVLIFKVMRVAVDRHVDKDEDEDEEESLNDVIASNTALMAGFAEAAQTLLSSIADDLSSDADNANCLEVLQDEMKGTTIIDLCSYFEDMIENMDDESMIQDCHVVSSSLLGCAGFLSAENRKEIQNEITKRLQDYSKISKEDRGYMNVVPYLAVFCSWNMAKEVALSLSYSVKRAFSEDDEDIVLLSPSASPPRRGKRKQSQVNGSTLSKFVVPVLQSEEAVSVVNTVLKGANPSCKTVRDAILSTEETTSAIINALEKATILAEKIISGPVASTINNEGSTEMILSACESFGRVLIHKEAYKNEELTLPPEAQRLLRWLTMRALPLIVSRLEDMSSSLGDLNISRISSIGVRESLSSSAPLSPLCLPPPRRKSTRRSTISKVDSSFVGMEDEGGVQFVVEGNCQDSFRMFKMVAGLFKSSITTFFEWISLGGGGVQEITESVMKWTELLDCDFQGSNVKLELFPSFCAFSGMVASKSSNCGLLQDLLIAVRFEEDSNVDTCYEEAVKFVLSKKETRLLKLEELSSMLLSNLNTEECESFQDFVDQQRLGVKVALRTVLSKSDGVSVFGQVLSDKLLANGTQSLEALLVLLFTEYSQLKDHLRSQFTDGDVLEGLSALKEAFAVS